MRVAAVLLASLVISACQCGLEPVRDCHWALCDKTQGVTPDGGFDAGADASTGPGSTDDGGTTRPVDAGVIVKPRSDGGFEWAWGDPYEDCFPGGMGSKADIVSVHGLAGQLGVVNYSMRGASAGASGEYGIQRFTNAAYGTTNLPPVASKGDWDTGLWAWSSFEPVTVGTVYQGTNLDKALNNKPFFDLRISTDGPYIACKTGAGSGRFVFTRFGNVSREHPVEGMYEFGCPDAGVVVSGCFHYQ